MAPLLQFFVQLGLVELFVCGSLATDYVQLDSVLFSAMLPYVAGVLLISAGICLMWCPCPTLAYLSLIMLKFLIMLIVFEVSVLDQLGPLSWGTN